MRCIHRSLKSAVVIFLASTLGLGTVAPAFARDHSDGPSRWRSDRRWDGPPRTAPHRYYRPYAPLRERYYYGNRVYRPYGHRHPGFGFYYRDSDAFVFLGLTAMTLVLLNQLSEAQQRAHEEAIIGATSAPIGEPIIWNQNGRWGKVTTVREGQTSDGRPCREFQQEVTISGRLEQAYGTACQQPDGAWKVVNN